METYDLIQFCARTIYPPVDVEKFKLAYKAFNDEECPEAVITQYEDTLKEDEEDSYDSSYDS